MAEEEAQGILWESFASLLSFFTGAPKGALPAVVNKGTELFESTKAHCLDCKVRETADLRGVLPNDTELGHKNIYKSSSVSSAFQDVDGGVVCGGAAYVLYGQDGCGLTTTLHAIVRGRRPNGTVVGDGAVVFQTKSTREVALTGNAWFAEFQSLIGKGWVGLSGSETASKLTTLLLHKRGDKFQRVLDVSGFAKLPAAYDPDTVKSLAPDVHSMFAGGEGKSAFEYKRRLPTILKEHRTVLVGLDDVNFEGDLHDDTCKNARNFFTGMSGSGSGCDSHGLILIIATHNLGLAQQIVKLQQGRGLLRPMITSVFPTVDGEVVRDGVYENYKEFVSHRDREGWHRKGDYEWDHHLRLDAQRKKLLLSVLFDIKSDADNLLLEDALQEPSLKRSMLLLQRSNVSPGNSPIKHDKLALSPHQGIPAQVGTSVSEDTHELWPTPSAPGTSVSEDPACTREMLTTPSAPRRSTF